MMKRASRGGLLLAVSVLFLLPCSSLAFQISNKNPSQQQLSSSSQASTLKGTNSKTSPVVKAAVGLLTGGVNNLIGDKSASLPAASTTSKSRPLSPALLKKKIEEDYSNAYFLTGQISADAYDEDCVFTDPTLSFTGLKTWTRNIANLKIFFREPRLELTGIQLNSARQTVETQWRLTTELALPWKPFIDVEGGTVHRYDPAKGNRVVEHVESWAVSGLEAVLLLFIPGGKAKAQAQARRENNNNNNVKSSSSSSFLSKAKSGVRLFATTVLPASLSFLSSSSGPLPMSGSSMIVHAADDKRQVADIPASGIIFKDSINVEAFRDPKVEGVTIYISDFRRPLAERIAKDFFSDPSQASVACVRTGPVKMNKIDMSKAGEEVFSEARSLLFKTIRVRRVYDKEANAIIYVSYSTRFSKNEDDNKSRFKSSLCAVPLEDDAVAAGAPQ